MLITVWKYPYYEFGWMLDMKLVHWGKSTQRTCKKTQH